MQCSMSQSLSLCLHRLIKRLLYQYSLSRFIGCYLACATKLVMVVDNLLSSLCCFEYAAFNSEVTYVPPGWEEDNCWRTCKAPYLSISPAGNLDVDQAGGVVKADHVARQTVSEWSSSFFSDVVDEDRGVLSIIRRGADPARPQRLNSVYTRSVPDVKPTHEPRRFDEASRRNDFTVRRKSMATYYIAGNRIRRETCLSNGDGGTKQSMRHST